MDDHRDQLAAIVTLLAAIAFAWVVNTAILRRGHRLAAIAGGGRELSPVADTRLRLVRRLAVAAILVFGLALALSNLDGVRQVATGILASSAVLGLVVGFAARQVFANAVSGVMLAITQPLRIGDLVTFEDETGTVEDIRLTYTYLRAADGRRIIVPNERLAQSTIENHTIVDARSHVEVKLWLEPGADSAEALERLRSVEDVDVTISDVTPEGIELTAGTWVDHPQERAAASARIRAACLERLQAGA